MEIISGNYNDPASMMQVPRSLAMGTRAKRIVRYSLMYTSTCILMAYVTSGFGMYTSTKLLYLIAMLCFGAAHVWSSLKWNLFVAPGARRIGLLYSLWLAIFIGIMTTLVYFFEAVHHARLPIAGASSFLLPSLVAEAWYYFKSITTRSSKPWLPPAPLPGQSAKLVYLDSLELKIRVKRNYFDLELHTIDLVTARSMPLGKMFGQFVRAEEESGMMIQLRDQHSQPYRWTFTLVRPLLNRPLDPERTIDENQVKEGQTILVERA